VPTPTSRAGTSSRGPEGGFTFIELAVVLILLGILLVFIVPRFGNIGRGGVSAAARRLHGVVATVHDKAALQKRRYWLAVEVGGGAWWVLATEPDQSLTKEELVARKDQAVMDGKLPGEVVFEDVYVEGQKTAEGTALARFEPNGTCAETQIHLADGAGGAATLSVEPWTGRCTVADSYALPAKPRVPGEEGESVKGQGEEKASPGQDEEPLDEQEPPVDEE
jgi:prepilin-type N-terminal cleavage/methylation domain-containing protein